MNIVIGKKAILDAITNGTLQKVITSDSDKNFLQIVKKNCPNIVINNDKFFYQKITNISNHQFAIGYVITKNRNSGTDLSSFLQRIKNKENNYVVLIDSIIDPMNFGNIIRSAEILGADGIIYRKDRQVQITPSVIKASAGAINNICMIKTTNLINAINKLKQNGYWVYACCLDKTAYKLHDIKFHGKIAVVIGNEDKGVSQLVIKNSDFKVYIEQTGKTQSLNAAAAAAIVFYEIASKLYKNR